MAFYFVAGNLRKALKAMTDEKKKKMTLLKGEKKNVNNIFWVKMVKINI